MWRLRKEGRQAAQDGGGIATGAAQSGAGGNRFFQLDHEAAVPAGRLAKLLGGAEGQVVATAGQMQQRIDIHAGRGHRGGGCRGDATELLLPSAEARGPAAGDRAVRMIGSGHADAIETIDRHHHGFQFVVAIGTLPQQFEVEVEFRRGEDRGRTHLILLCGPKAR